MLAPFNIFIPQSSLVLPKKEIVQKKRTPPAGGTTTAALNKHARSEPTRIIILIVIIALVCKGAAQLSIRSSVPKQPRTLQPACDIMCDDDK
jgi:hypothetical protein